MSENVMTYTRREMGSIMLGAGTGLTLQAAGKPNSKFGGVQIGVITYCFRELRGGAEETLKYCVECGINAIELMSNVAESYAGAPLPAGRGPFGGPPSGGGRPPGGPGGRPPLTPEQRAAMEKAAAELKDWRLSASMEKYRAFRKMYNDAGLSIYAFKLPPTMAMTDGEYDYIWECPASVGNGEGVLPLR